MIALLGSLAAKYGLDLAWEFVKEHWLPITLGAIGIAAVSTIAIQGWRIDSYQRAAAVYEKSISDAVEANRLQTDTIRRLEKIAEDERLAIKQLRAAHDLRQKKYDELEKEFSNVPALAAPAGPDFDRAAERLRALDQGGD